MRIERAGSAEPERGERSSRLRSVNAPPDSPLPREGPRLETPLPRASAPAESDRSERQLGVVAGVLVGMAVFVLGVLAVVTFGTNRVLQALPTLPAELPAAAIGSGGPTPQVAAPAA